MVAKGKKSLAYDKGGTVGSSQLPAEARRPPAAVPLRPDLFSQPIGVLSVLFFIILSKN